MKIICLLLLASSLGILGEISCKYAAIWNSMWMTLIGAMCWGLCAFVWTEIYRTKSIVQGVILFNPLQMVALALTGIVLFGDKFDVKMVVAGVLACICIFLLL